MATAQRPRQSTIPIRLGPWKGVRDLGDAGAQDPAFAQDAINCWFQDPQNGGSVWARPGFEKFTDTTGLNSGGAVQGFAGWVNATGNTFYVFAFVAGKVYRYSTGTTWTDVTPVGVTIDTVINRIHVRVYNGELIVNDQVNEPWRGTDLTSTPITGTEIEINTAGSAWTAVGAPTIHGGKVFFIVGIIASTSYFNRIVWSEEASAATGYLQDGFTNSWDLLQSQVPTERIFAIQGTNTGLYYFRNRSIGVIYGAVNADFATASTHDGVSSDIGVHNRSGDVCLAGNYIWFIDTALRPCRFRVGSTEIDPIWKQMRQRFQVVQEFRSSAISPSDVQIAHVADLNKVAMLFLPDSGGALSKHLYIFDVDTGNYEGRWIIQLASQPSDENPTAVGVRQIAAIHRADSFGSAGGEGMASLIVGGKNTSGGDGHIWSQTPFVMYTTESTSLGDAGGAMHMSLTTMLTPDEQDVEFLVTECSMEAGPDSATLSLDQYVPRGAATALSITGITNSDSIQSSHDHGVFRAGLFQLGRWWRGVFHWNVASGATPYFFERALITVKPRRTIGVTK